ncbi:LPXTG cell wall anchor domain-containing protein [Kordia sp. TARA_039_SRF]|jgi:LPXTG-motif cell wall-anchored protein|nr:LPXTG cell wall anchor domain-containing protein [Kordia sp. TARA_039_SRF]
MNKSIKMVLLIAGIALIAYGIYMVISPETSVDLAVAEIEGQDNTNAFITIGLGIVALLGGLLGGKK